MQRNQRPVGRPRQDQKAKPTKAVILEAATWLFLDQGYQSVSMDEVAKESGVTKATVYYYYATKADLFTDAMVQMMIRIRGQIMNLLSGDQPLRERLLNVAKSHLEATADLDINSFLKEAHEYLSGEQRQQIKASEDSMYRVVEEKLARAMEKGEIPEGHPQLAAHAFVALLSIGQYETSEQKRIISDVNEMAEQIVDFYWNGLNG
ncbi:MAG TPA: TetR/AcrR family transcriptional regulator [Bacillaceae bacterium]